MKRRFLMTLGMAVFLASATFSPSVAFGFEAFDNSPTTIMNSPNDKASEARKESGVSKFKKAQKDYIDKKVTKEEYIRQRTELIRSLGGKVKSGEIPTAPQGDSDTTTAKSTGDFSTYSQSESLTLGVQAVEQVCREYCGPASTYAVLAFSGEYGLTQYEIADLEGTGACTPLSSSGANEGTCLSPIRDVLNSYYKNIPWSNYFVMKQLDMTSLSSLRLDYSSVTDYSISTQHTPFIQLLNAKPCDGTTYLDGWGGTSSCDYGHYVTTRGYTGFYEGSAGSRTIHYVDTAWWTEGQKTIDLHDITYMLYVKTDGSCESTHRHLVY